MLVIYRFIFPKLDQKCNNLTCNFYYLSGQEDSKRSSYISCEAPWSNESHDKSNINRGENLLRA